MAILHFLWKYKIGMITGGVYTLVSWILIFITACGFYGHDYYNFCETSIGKFLLSLDDSYGIAFMIIALSSGFLSLPLELLMIPPFPNSITLVFWLIYFMFLGAIIEYGLRKFFHILFHKSQIIDFLHEAPRIRDKDFCR